MKVGSLVSSVSIENRSQRNEAENLGFHALNHGNDPCDSSAKESRR
jgi:hypothetical protein